MEDLRMGITIYTNWKEGITLEDLRMGITIYTKSYEFFRMGGNPYGHIKTEIEEYERVSIGLGYYGLIIRNPFKELWHLALEGCGAIIATGKSRAHVLAAVIADMAQGDEEIMKEQVTKGMVECGRAQMREPDYFFNGFKGKKRKEP